MVENNEQEGEGTKEKEEKTSEKEEEKEEEEVITLSKEQYGKLMDRVDSLEQAALSLPERDELEDLADRGRRGGMADEEEEAEAEAGEIDFENITNRQLYNVIVDAVNKAAKPLVVDLQTLKVLREIDKCELKHEDFQQYEGEIRALAMKRPALSIEEAYQLVKAGEADEKSENKTEGRTTVTEKVLNLPKRTASGERPGVSRSATKKVEDLETTKEAAEKAWEEQVGSKTTLE